MRCRTVLPEEPRTVARTTAMESHCSVHVAIPRSHRIELSPDSVQPVVASVMQVPTVCLYVFVRVG